MSDESEEVDDATLIERWRRGDRDAGSRLFERHFRSVFRFHRSKLPEEARDLTQRTFLAAMESKDDFRGEARFSTYLLAIARRLLLNHLRQTGTHDRMSERGDALERLDPSPSGVVLRSESHRLLLHGLRRIPLEHQIILELRYWEQLSTSEIALVIAVPEGTVRSRLTRAREHLRRAFAELEADPALIETTMADLAKWAQDLRRAFDADDDEKKSAAEGADFEST